MSWTLPEDAKLWMQQNLPENMHDGILLYLERRIRPGGFLELIFCNDFVHAAAMADDWNKHKLYEYAQFLYLFVPYGAQGSREKLEDWIDE